MDLISLDGAINVSVMISMLQLEMIKLVVVFTKKVLFLFQQHLMRGFSICVDKSKVNQFSHIAKKD